MTVASLLIALAAVVVAIIALVSANRSSGRLEVLEANRNTIAEAQNELLKQQGSIARSRAKIEHMLHEVAEREVAIADASRQLQEGELTLLRERHEVPTFEMSAFRESGDWFVSIRNNGPQSWDSVTCALPDRRQRQCRFDGFASGGASSDSIALGRMGPAASVRLPIHTVNDSTELSLAFRFTCVVADRIREGIAFCGFS